MFKKARIELTAWYLVIIMSISILFSGLIYRSVSMDLERRLMMIEHRLQREEMGFRPKMMDEGFGEDLKAARKGLVLILVWTNGVILFLSGGAGWFLAGRTLKPIEKSLEEQKRFVADASHELRTPLTVLKTSIEVALRKKKMSGKESREIIKSNLEEVEDLERLTENLLTLARYQEGKNGFQFEKTGLVDLVERAIKKVAVLAKKEEVKIEKKLINTFLMADRERIEELLVILLDNGIKYTKRGGKIGVFVEESKREVFLRIKDDGEGIKKKDLPYIFDRFYRADESRSKQERKGFGLGLSVAKKIVEEHRGSIEVISKRGRGSEFIVKLPK